ncbi:endonuclease/exonuclease/phosphatase family protein [Microbacterium sp. ET2]|uniref:endonuclease/exonuclease/phosphatase family protein n=1 Tax=Microbacterium albipurpureum TaxID=3050384 RepID=UPI00259D00E0|nr:endonuclease/exonuclease/phosphatase family protein [Microbacterium sp. ET2 (Ac-2212)]WJL96535.1 endonuclease/exonuclease/phosphatase family protein [Microbacterium sp. ET2 (Ac-2212)]
MRTARRRRSRLIWTVVALLIAGAAVALPHVDVLAGGFIPVAQALVPVGAVALVVLAVVPLFFRASAAAVILVIGGVLAGLPALTPLRTGSDCAADSTVTVIAFNAKFAGADPARLAARIAEADADIVALVETDEAHIAAVLNERGLAEALPHRTRETSEGGVRGSVILSAFPLHDEQDISGSVFDQVTAVATLPGGEEVQVAAVHPPPPVGQPVDWRTAIGDLDRWIRDTPDELLIVAGDLNASYAHPGFRQLASPLRSAAEAAGPIPWPTWPQERPVPAFTAIDHVLARGAVPTGWASFSIPGSDHRGVIGSWGICSS